MNDGTIIGIDTAKSSFALHRADVSGVTLFRKTCRRIQLLPFLSKQPRCTVAVKFREMQAKATLFRFRALLIRQRTQTTNSIRGLLLELGWTPKCTQPPSGGEGRSWEHAPKTLKLWHIHSTVM